jgi:predicted transcriptional regulator
MRTPKESQELVYNIITDILQTKNQQNDDYITKVCKENNISEKHIRAVGDFQWFRLTNK